MSQEAQILAWLASGRTLTALDALHRFGTLRLSARILGLRRAGHDIRAQMQSIGTKRVAVYRLAKQGQA